MTDTPRPAGLRDVTPPPPAGTGVRLTATPATDTTQPDPQVVAWMRGHPRPTGGDAGIVRAAPARGRPAVSDPAKVFTAGDPEPDCPPGTLAVVNQGDYREQEVWVSSGSNIGNWYPLGGEHWAVWRRVHIPPAVTKQYPTWSDVTARGPVTLMVSSPSAAYGQGWDDGRARLLEQIEDLRDAESAR